MADHVHLAVRLSRTVSVAELVKEIKTASSKWVKMQDPLLHHFAWQQGYGVFSVGMSQKEAIQSFKLHFSVGTLLPPTLTVSHHPAKPNTMEEEIQQLRPDSKGRITLGKLARGVSSFRARRADDGNIILEPFTEIPAREKWLFENPSVFDAVKAGLAQAAEGKTRTLGSFAQYVDEDSE